MPSLNTDWRLPVPYRFSGVAVTLASFVTAVAVADKTAADVGGIDWLQLSMDLFGGLALFLAGLEVLSEGLKKAARNTLHTVLEKLTVNRFLGAITGAFVTGVLNSSSVTMVLVVGFVTAGVMTLSQSVGVIMGANVGSTVTAQILAFNVSAYALIPVAIGFFMYFGGKTERMRHFGMMIMGLGLVFYGMGLMSEAMKPLRTYEPFMELLAKMENPIFGILAGAVFTGSVRRSYSWKVDFKEAVMKRRNSRFGCPRIAQQISKVFGIEIDKDVVRRVLAKHYRPESGGDAPSEISGEVFINRTDLHQFRWHTHCRGLFQLPVGFRP
jgi:hypothetical protein